MGEFHNWFQVFGTNKFLWPFPIFSASGKPLGDGIYWPTNKPGSHTEEGVPEGSQQAPFSPQKESTVSNSQTPMPIG